MRYSTVLFDFDGTLVDTNPLIISSFRHCAQEVLGETITEEQVAEFVGGSTIVDQMARLAPTRVEELVEAYRRHNYPLYERLQDGFAGVEELLATLAARGCRLGVVTSKRRTPMECGLAACRLDGYFEVLVASEDSERHKPDPQPVLAALARLGVTAAEAAYVGDSPFDMKAGRSAGVFAVGVSWGGVHSAERLLEAGADLVVARPEELIDAL